MKDSSSNYPGAFNNDPSENTENFRDQSTINQPAGGINFVNTKNSESVELYHKSGSHLNLNKFSNDEFAANSKRTIIQENNTIHTKGTTVEITDKDKEELILGNNLLKIGDIEKWARYAQDYKDLLKPLHDKKRLFEFKQVQYENFIDHAPNQTQAGTYEDCPIESKTGTFLYTVNPTIYTPAKKQAFNHTFPEYSDIETEYKTIEFGGDYCWTCGGTHLSPSSHNGNWDKENIKDTIAKDRISIQNKLFDIEKHFGGQNKHTSGGTTIEKIANDYVGIVGLAMNTFESTRIDKKGKLVPCGMKISPTGEYLAKQYCASTLVEKVHVDSLLGGNYDLTVCDKYNLTVGSNGISIKTTGIMELYSPLIHIASNEIQLHTIGEIGLIGERVDISADIISLRPNKIEKDNLPENGTVLVDGNLQVVNNMIVRGGAHIEGEVTLQHVTMPFQTGITDECFEWGKQSSCAMDDTVAEECSASVPEKSPVYADMLKGCTIGWNRDFVTLYGVCSDGATCEVYIPPHTIYIESLDAENTIMVHPHLHTYAQPAIKLIKSNTDISSSVGDNSFSVSADPNSTIRALGAKNNFINPVLPLPAQNSKTNFTITENCETLETGSSGIEDETVEKYSSKEVKQMISQLEAKFEAKYKELLSKLDKIN